MPNKEGIKCILLDIEGTVCPISFVKDTLFPYALKALPDVLSTKWNDEDFKAYRDAFPESVRRSSEELQAHVEDLTKRDVKVASLKNLQGYLWESGYKSGAYSTPLFPDVAACLKEWKKDGFQLAIYSSGSVFAQKLLFGHVKTGEERPNMKRKREIEAEESDSPDGVEPPLKKQADATKHTHAERPTIELFSGLQKGQIGQSQRIDAAEEQSTRRETDDVSDRDATEDLQYLIAEWFDPTNAGLKTESASYEKIADKLNWSPTKILFLSDNVKEVDAAVAAGMHSIMVDRPGNAPLSDVDRDRLEIVHSLDAIKVVQSRERAETKQSHSAKPNQRKSQRLRDREDQSK